MTPKEIPLYGDMNNVGSSVAWSDSTSPGKLIEIRMANEQQTINKPRIMRLIRMGRDMLFCIQVSN